MEKSLYKTSGIYCIENLENGKRYIGSSVNVGRRMSKHRGELRRGKHHSRYLQNTYNKNGIEIFRFFLLEEVEEYSNLLKVEQEYLDREKPEYNMCPTAGNRLGYRHSEETKKLLAAAARGNTNFLGRKHTDEAKEKLRRANKGKKMSPEAIEKMRLANLGRKRPQSDKDKISSTMKKQSWRRSITDNATIKEIRTKNASGIGQRKLAKEYGVSKEVIRNIVQYRHGYTIENTT